MSNNAPNMKFPIFQYTVMTMPLLVVWSGLQILWPTAAERVASPHVCHSAPSVSRKETMMGMTSTCSVVKQAELVTVGIHQ